VACRTREQHCPDVEPEQVVITGWFGYGKPAPLLDELACQGCSEVDIRNRVSMTGEVKGILVVFHGKRVHRVSPVSVEILLFRGRNDEAVETVLRQQWAHRVQPRSTVWTDRAEEGEADPEVI
jgi:hypothetical protein